MIGFHVDGSKALFGFVVTDLVAFNCRARVGGRIPSTIGIIDVGVVDLRTGLIDTIREHAIAFGDDDIVK